MAKPLGAFVAGALFGAGLVVSQMVNPAKILGFLDIAGNWDPSLALVMGGALAVSIVAFRLTLGKERPILEDRFWLPSAKDIDPKLIGGALIFGVGWGLAGFCPGPAIASLVLGIPQSVVFVVSMLAGMALYRFRPAPAAVVTASDG